MKKVLLLIMAVAMCGIAQAATNYEINVGGIEVNTDNYNNVTGGDITLTSGCSSGYVKFNPSTNTLTLKNITIERTGSGNYAVHNRKRDNLNIEFIGNCRLYSDNAPGMKLQRNTTIKFSGTDSYASVEGNCNNNKPAVEIDDGRTLTINGGGSIGFYGGKTTTPTIKGGSSISFNDGCQVTIRNNYVSSNAEGGYCFSQQTLYFNPGCYVSLDNDSDSEQGLTNGCSINLGSGVKILTADIAPYVGYAYNGAIYTDSGEKVHWVAITSHYAAIMNSDYFPDANFLREIYNYNLTPGDWHGTYFRRGWIYDSEVPLVKDLNVSGCNIYSLEGIQYLTDIETLNCSKNHIPALNSNLSKLTKLKVLDCSENTLSTLSLINNTALTSLDCHSNQMTSLNNVPGTLKTFNGSSNRFTSFTFSGRNLLNTVDLSSNPYLTDATVSYCPALTSLNITNCPALKTLSCTGDKLTSLDLTGCSALTTLDCSDNQLTSLTNIPTSLQSLNCSYNKFSGTFSLTNRSALKKLDIANNPNLTTLNCYSNALTNLYVNDCPAMTKLVCNHNQLTSLGLSGCKALYYLDCEYNKLTSISLAIAGNTSLKEVYLNHNQISSIPTFSNETKSSLEVLGLSDNKLTSFTAQSFTKLWALGLRDNPNLTTVTVTNNSVLRSFGVSNCPALTTLTCNNNALESGNSATGFYFAGSNAIKNFNCSYNQLTALDVSSLSNLTDLKCYNNKITSLNVSNKTKLTELRCNYNELTSLNVQGCSALTYLSCGANKLSSLSVQGCNSLTGLNCCLNQIKESGANTLVNSLRTIPAGSQGNLEFVAPGYTNNGVAEANVITDAQVRAARNKRWIPKKFVNSQWVEIPVSAAVPGDVNGDGVVTAADVTALYDFMLTNDSSHIVNGDQNGDGNITSADITAVYDVLLGNS
ncbi:MAG: hypothetical protein IKW83_00865 [Muribaculaceae bacterium]|nr:hypothetical protein [Muribaculaceae bacterium]